jgi:hypothetical protein
MLLHFFVDGFSCLVVVSVPVKIYISMGEFGGPQALPGGAQPYPNPLYGGEGLSLEKLGVYGKPKVMFNYLIIDVLNGC